MNRFALGPFRSVADRVFVAVAEPATVNVGLVVGDDAALLIDTGSTPGQGHLLRQAVEQTAGVPLQFVVVTHHHYDHLFGLAGFADLPTIAHRRLLSTTETEPLPAWLGPRLGPDWTPPRPNESFADERHCLDLGGCPVVCWQPGRGHTDHDLVVWLPGRRVAFLGDLAESSGPPVAGPDAWPADWPRTLGRVLHELADAEVFVPGHGPTMTRAQLAAQLDQLAFLDRQSRILAAQGHPAAGAWRPDWPWSAPQAEPFIDQALHRLATTSR